MTRWKFSPDRRLSKRQAVEFDRLQWGGLGTAASAKFPPGVCGHAACLPLVPCRAASDRPRLAREKREAREKLLRQVSGLLLDLLLI